MTYFTSLSKEQQNVIIDIIAKVRNIYPSNVEYPVGGYGYEGEIMNYLANKLYGENSELSRRN